MRPNLVHFARMVTRVSNLVVVEAQVTCNEPVNSRVNRAFSGSLDTNTGVAHARMSNGMGQDILERVKAADAALGGCHSQLQMGLNSQVGRFKKDLATGHAGSEPGNWRRYAPVSKEREPGARFAGLPPQRQTILETRSPGM